MITINYKKVKEVLSREEFRKFKKQRKQYQVYIYQTLKERGKIKDEPNDTKE